MARPINDPFTEVTDKTTSDNREAVSPRLSPLSPTFLFSAIGTPTWDQHFSSLTDASYPSLFDYSSGHLDSFPSPPLAARITSTVDSGRSTHATSSAAIPTAPPASVQSTTSKWSTIARDAQALRDQWNEESAAISPRATSMDSTPAATTRPTRVNFVDRSTTERSRPPVTERRSSLRLADGDPSTPTHAATTIIPTAMPGLTCSPEWR